ncbi:hypothetical protein C8E08_4940 [Paracidovorax citrulli]|nr:hypothetical protein C8E08_4940 [Paracidovorax citrulli]REG68345.1 hypothetical protein C8E07_1451 [Paracidovorax citrulli]RLJ92903.1 hypothetical protein C8E06_1452 [Paracidovorax citrulli]
MAKERRVGRVGFALAVFRLIAKPLRTGSQPP